MSQRPKTGEKLFFLMTSGMIILACSLFVPKSADTPTIEPSKAAPEVIPISQPTNTIQPTTRPAPKPTQTPIKIIPKLLPTTTNTPHSILTQTPIFPTGTGPYEPAMTNACLLVQMNGVAALFPNLPPPALDFQEKDGASSSICKFIDGQTYLVIAVVSNSAGTEFNELLNNMKVIEGFTQFSVAEANIYQTRLLSPDDKTISGLGAVIMKGDRGVEILGTSPLYHYDQTRESLFLTRVAQTMPFKAQSRNACGLVTVEEITRLFPNPAAPNMELNTDKGYPVSICKFVNDQMDFTFSLASSPDLADELTREMGRMMNETSLVTHFTASEAEVYEMGGRFDESQVGDGFYAVIIKNDISIEVKGSGKSYGYDAEREAQLLNAIAGRLP